MRRHLKLSVLGTVLGLLLSSVSLGTEVPFDVDFPFTVINVPFEGSWTVGSPDAPMPMDIVFDGGSLIKFLESPGLLTPWSTVNLWEHFEVTGTDSWTSWQEQILFPDLFPYKWGASISFQVVPDVGAPFDPAGLALTQTDDALMFTFDPLAPGTMIDIHKELIFTGSLPIKLPQFAPGLFVNEFAAPEPSSIMLFALGAVGVGLIGTRRRRRA